MESFLTLTPTPVDSTGTGWLAIEPRSTADIKLQLNSTVDRIGRRIFKSPLALVLAELDVYGDLTRHRGGLLTPNMDSNLTFADVSSDPAWPEYVLSRQFLSSGYTLNRVLEIPGVLSRRVVRQFPSLELMRKDLIYEELHGVNLVLSDTNLTEAMAVALGSSNQRGVLGIGGSLVAPLAMDGSEEWINDLTAVLATFEEILIGYPLTCPTVPFVLARKYRGWGHAIQPDVKEEDFNTIVTYLNQPTFYLEEVDLVSLLPQWNLHYDQLFPGDLSWTGGASKIVAEVNPVV